MWSRLALHPTRWRWTSMVHHLELYSLRSVPIIALINFLVGAIVMQQGIFQLGALRRLALCGQSGRRPGPAGARRC